MTPIAAALVGLANVQVNAHDPDAIATVLSADPLLAPLVRDRPGLRVPGSVDAEEIAIRAVLGQQVSVARATALASRLTEQLGARLPQPRHGVDRTFPTAAAVAEADLEGIGLTAERAATLRRLTLAIAGGDIDLTAAADGAETARRLLSIRGIGAWTVAYVAMRGLRDPDAFPAGDLGMRRAFARTGGGDDAALVARAERWRPWRAYATVHLWNQLSHPVHTMETSL